MNLRPYVGSRTHEHFGATPGRRHSTSVYGSDRSGTIRYEFNELGFRGDDLDLDADTIIYVAGCSHTFGTGNTQERSWPTQFADNYARHHGLDAERMSLMNFSEGGTSNRFICRTLIDQCRAHQPDLAIAHFSEVARTEYMVPPGLWPDEDKPVSAVGPWLQAGWLKRQIWLLRGFRGAERLPAKTILDWAHGYYAHAYQGRRAAYETLQDMLMFQQFCQLHDIEFMMCCVDYDKLVTALDNLVVRILWDMIDHDRLVDFAVSDSSLTSVASYASVPDPPP